MKVITQDGNVVDLGCDVAARVREVRKVFFNNDRVERSLSATYVLSILAEGKMQDVGKFDRARRATRVAEMMRTAQANREPTFRVPSKWEEMAPLDVVTQGRETVSVQRDSVVYVDSRWKPVASYWGEEFQESRRMYCVCALDETSCEEHVLGRYRDSEQAFKMADRVRMAMLSAARVAMEQDGGAVA